MPKKPSISQPTEGEWYLEFNPKFDLHPRVMSRRADGRRVCIASTCGTKTTRDLLTTGEKLANARLIAAAKALAFAVRLEHECGAPMRFTEQDETGVKHDAWVWTDLRTGAQWKARGSWNAKPLFPSIADALKIAEGGKA